MAAASAPLGVSCITCRRRRVKCDRAIPTCGACKRLSLVCSYKIATPGLYWMPINTVEADTDRVGKQDDAGGYGERTASSHRAPLCTGASESGCACQEDAIPRRSKADIWTIESYQRRKGRPCASNYYEQLLAWISMMSCNL